MTDSYNELKDLPDLRGSRPLVIRDPPRLTRPPSLSESHAWTEENVERAMSLMAPLATTPPLPPTLPPPPDPHRPLPCASHHLLLLSSLFHLTLVSLFETLFFFFYVSTLENAGIVNTVSGFTGALLRDCEHLSPDGKELARWALSVLVNTTAVEADGLTALTDREAFNERLLLLAWYYAIGIACCFSGTLAVGVYRGLPIPWTRLCAENCCLVLLLGLFEGLFFTTIVYSYKPLSGPEIAGALVSDLQTDCLATQAP